MKIGPEDHLGRDAARAELAIRVEIGLAVALDGRVEECLHHHVRVLSSRRYRRSVRLCGPLGLVSVRRAREPAREDQERHDERRSEVASVAHGENSHQSALVGDRKVFVEQ